MKNNRLNDLTSKEWIKFQKSWFIHNPPPRRKDVLRHPAKFPETMVEEFITFFTKQGQVVLDPMAGTGSTLVAAMRQGRHCFGVELNPEYAEIARQVVVEEREALGELAQGLTAEIIKGNAACFADYVREWHIPPLDYVITSPPYWDMLHARGAATQKKRRDDQSLDVVYSENVVDLGNVADYEEFVERLVKIYAGLQPFLRDRAYLTIIVKNVKKGGKIYPLAWDLGKKLNEIYTLKDEKIWCLPPGEGIWTKTGLCPIESIEKGDSVLTHTGKLERVVKTMQRHHVGEIIVIRPAMLGCSVRLTPEHEVLAIRRRQYIHTDGTTFHENFKRSYARGAVWLPVRELCVGDAVAYPIPTDEMDLIEFDTTPYLPRPEDWYEDGDWYVTKWRGKRGRGRLPRTIPVNTSFLRLAGWFLSEGSSNSSGVHIANLSQEAQEEIATLLHQVFHANTSRDKKGVWCRSRTVARFLTNLFGNGARSKFIPNFVLHLPLEKQKHLLRTLWQGDGHIGRDGRVSYKTASPDLALGIFFLTARFGALPCIQRDPNWNNLLFRSLDAKVLREVLEKEASPINHIRRQHWQRDNMVWLPIRDINRVGYDGPVLNLEVENANSYTTAGFVVHNCQDNQRLAPYGMGSAWVSNTFHHYCLQFRNE